MSPELAIFACVLFILGLVFLDWRRHARVSPAVWLVVAWLVIFSSRPISAWVGMEGGSKTLESEIDGNPIDRDIFLLLILVAVWVLRKRNVDWWELVSNNRWLFAFYVYLFLSILWSDYPFVSFKRWWKDFANILMVLVVFTEEDPLEAVHTLLARCAYLLIPLSVVLIKYYPAIGRSYSFATGEPHNQGLTLGKNQLGSVAFIVTLFLVWDLLLMLRSQSQEELKVKISTRFVLAMMGLWMLWIAKSATSLACAILGSLALVALGLESTRKNPKRLMTYTVVTALGLSVLSAVFDFQAVAAGMLGRDPTLTGRDKIWKAVLAEDVNPLIGTGYYSFWLGTRPQRVSEKCGFWFVLNQAHNGYLETYLNSGLVGVCLLIAALLAAGSGAVRSLAAGSPYGQLRLSFLVVGVIYNWTEAAFNRQGMFWFVLLMVMMKYPPLTTGQPEYAGEDLSNGDMESQPHQSTEDEVDSGVYPQA